MFAINDEKVASVALFDCKSHSERHSKGPDTEYYILFLSKKCSKKFTRTKIILDLSIDIKYGSTNEGVKPLFEDSRSDYQSIKNNLKINTITKENQVIIFIRIHETETSAISKINMLHQGSNIKQLKILNIIEDFSNFLFDIKAKDIEESIATQIFEEKLDLSANPLLLQDENTYQGQRDSEVAYIFSNNILYFEKDCSKASLPYQFEILRDPKLDVINDFENIMCQELDRLSITEKPLENKTVKINLESVDSLHQNSTDFSSPEKEDVSAQESVDLMNLSMPVNSSAPKDNPINSRKTHEKECQTDKITWDEFINSEYDTFKNKVSGGQDIKSLDVKQALKFEAQEEKTFFSVLNEDAATKEQLEYTRKFYLFEKIKSNYT